MSKSGLDHWSFFVQASHSLVKPDGNVGGIVPVLYAYVLSNDHYHNELFSPRNWLSRRSLWLQNISRQSNGNDHSQYSQVGRQCPRYCACVGWMRIKQIHSSLLGSAPRLPLKAFSNKYLRWPTINKTSQLGKKKSFASAHVKNRKLIITSPWQTTAISVESFLDNKCNENAAQASWFYYKQRDGEKKRNATAFSSPLNFTLTAMLLWQNLHRCKTTVKGWTSSQRFPLTDESTASSDQKRQEAFQQGRHQPTRWSQTLLHPMCRVNGSSAQCCLHLMEAGQLTDCRDQWTAQLSERQISTRR